MKKLTTIAVFLAPTMAFAAGGPTPLGPNNGKFGDWTAATYGSGHAKACYAFTNAQHSNPAIKSRGDVMLTVTERPGTHDEVTLSAGYVYPPKGSVELTVGSANVSFYTKGSTAFTGSGGDAIKAFKNGSTATAKSTGPHGHPVTDDFSLSGFSGAYAAITAACP